MKKLLIIFTVLFVFQNSNAQSSEAKQRKMGWFVSPEVGGIFHGDHLGKTIGTSFGVKLFNNRLKAGVQFYNRSGPINPTEFTIEASGGQTYKGSSTLTLRADHGATGLFLAPVFNIGNISLDVPIAFGFVGAGFYFTGDDRNTPDGRRVSEWENQLMEESDGGFGNWIEVGTRVFIPTKNEHVSFGAGLHYTMTPGWETYFSPNGDFYNKRLRFSLVVIFESK